MSIVQSGLLRKHYDDAVHGIEYQSAAFWTVVLNRAFYELDVYSVTPESSPDGTLRRVDLVVKKYDPANNSLSALLWIECKRPGGSVQEVEDQALDAAKRCIQRDGLLWIWAMTTIGVSFRMWYIGAGGLKLVPMHGLAVEADKSQYVDADSPGASVFLQAIQCIKLGVPLRQAPVVPSQSLDLLNTAQGEQDMQADYTQAGAIPFQVQSQYGHEVAEAGPSSGYDDDEGVGSGDQCIEVKVQKAPHTFSHDEYIFRDNRGKRRSTKKEDWESGMYRGEMVWFFNAKNVSYFSRKRIG
ncbi:hypothetical protein F66182_7810 [Fusarium sp. NRRL 66182]|nr:hypothetical protein F66182_7810 [Fusarium sp. NRRL 66182]